MNWVGPPGAYIPRMAQTVPPRGETVYQHDIELIESFPRKNPDVIAKAREKLKICAVMYRCKNFHIFFPGKWLGETIACPVCGAGMRPEV